MKLTKWFPGKVKPVRLGVYQRRNPYQPIDSYSKWNGEFWCLYCPNKKMAAKENHPSNFQNRPWRGVAK